MLRRHCDPPKNLIQEIALKYGHQVLYLPQYHPELNAIEYAWSQVKGLASYGPTYNIEKLQNNVLPGCFATITPDKVKKILKHIQKVMCDLMEQYKYGRRINQHDGRYKVHPQILVQTPLKVAVIVIKKLNRDLSEYMSSNNSSSSSEKPCLSPKESAKNNVFQHKFPTSTSSQNKSTCTYSLRSRSISNQQASETSRDSQNSTMLSKKMVKLLRNSRSQVNHKSLT